MVQIPRKVSVPFIIKDGSAADFTARAINENFRVLYEEHNKLVGQLSLFFAESPFMRPSMENKP